MRFLFTCGGTAGHINPAVAVAEKLREYDPACEILFIGANNNMEMYLVPEEGFDIEGIKITNISREHNLEAVLHNLDTVKNVVKSIADAKSILKRFRPDAVIGTGGYVCYPVLTAAHDLRIPALVHESNAAPGLTTKMLAGKADRIMVGFEGCRENYDDKSKVIVTGTPVREGFSRDAKHYEKKTVLSFWGSLGAAYMNGIVSEMIPMLDGSFRLIHATGRKYYADFEPKDATDTEILEYIHNMPELMSRADLVICRAGASTLAELDYLGKRAILVPSPNVVNNHQEKNARAYGKAKVLLEKEFTANSLLNEIKCSLEEPEPECGNNDAAGKIADIILETVRKG